MLIDQLTTEQPPLSAHAGRLRPVLLALLLGAGLHLLWFFVFAPGGGDLAAQDAWAEFARLHPTSAYDFAWYGGMHPVSYSVVSPYVMALLGVRTTIVLAGTVSTAVLALILERIGIRRASIASVYGAFAFFGNAISGRVTFGLGLMFGLGALATVIAWPAPGSDRRAARIVRASTVGVLGALATAASPVAGLFLGVVAAALWLSGRRPLAYALGLPPVAVVGASAWLFPFSGEQPMTFASVILPEVCSAAILVTAPRHWRVVRIGTWCHAVGVVLVWLIPSPIGTNVTRLSLIFTGVVLLAIATENPLRWRNRPLAMALVASLITVTTWQVVVASLDAVNQRATRAWTVGLAPLVHQLRIRNTTLGRVEVVPARSHREASTLSPYVNLARGWNRQADVELNPLFYGQAPLNAATYRRWLDRWAVRYVAVPAGPHDMAGKAEDRLIEHGLPYLDEVWSSHSWQLYAVRSPAPLATPPATVTRFDSDLVVVHVPAASDVELKIPASPWLSIDNAKREPYPPGVHGCLTATLVPTGPDRKPDRWLVLRAPAAGTYRIGSPYDFGFTLNPLRPVIRRGTPCKPPALQP